MHMAEVQVKKDSKKKNVSDGSSKDLKENLPLKLRSKFH